MLGSSTVEAPVADRRYAFRACLGCALLLLLSSCGSDNPTTPSRDGPAAERLFQPNRLALQMRNDGSPFSTGGDALTYDGQTLMNDLGLWIGARVDGQVRVSATSYFGSEFEPLRFGAGDSVALVYILRPGDGPGNADYDAWPIRAGAPTDLSGRPLLTGNGTAWTAYDDLDRNLHAKFGSGPLGAIVRATIWGSAQPDSVLLIDLDIQNAGTSTWDGTLLGIWADADIGDAQNDLVGCDVGLKMGYTYTAPSFPETRFGAFQPALGILLLQTPSDSGFYAFPRIWKAWNEPHTAVDAYNLLQGLNIDGTAYRDSTTGEPTRYTASGDPVAGTGSIEHVPADRRMLVVTGPLTVAPGARISLQYAILFARDRDALHAITRLRAMATEDNWAHRLDR